MPAATSKIILFCIRSVFGGSEYLRYTNKTQDPSESTIFGKQFIK
jgi:hypothetical protein